MLVGVEVDREPLKKQLVRRGGDARRELLAMVQGLMFSLKVVTQSDVRSRFRVERSELRCSGQRSRPRCRVRASAEVRTGFRVWLEVVGAEG